MDDGWPAPPWTGQSSYLSRRTATGIGCLLPKVLAVAEPPHPAGKGRGEALFDVTYRFQKRVGAVRRELVDADLSALQADLAVIAELEHGTGGGSSLATLSSSNLRRICARSLVASSTAAALSS